MAHKQGKNPCVDCKVRLQENGYRRCFQCFWFNKHGTIPKPRVFKGTPGYDLCSTCRAAPKAGTSSYCTEHAKDMMAAYYGENRDDVLAACKVYRGKNLKRIQEYDRKRGGFRRLSPAAQEQSRVNKRSTIQRMRERVLAGYGGACTCCGETQPRFLAIDHVNNDGSIERKTSKGGYYGFLKRILDEKFPPRYQLLCHNCNLAKGFYGSCPHADAREMSVAA